MDQGKAEHDRHCPYKDQEEQREGTVKAEYAFQRSSRKKGAGRQRPEHPGRPVEKARKPEAVPYPAGKHDGFEAVPQDCQDEDRCKNADRY